jgi:hypothetical protein
MSVVGTIVKHPGYGCISKSVGQYFLVAVHL